MGKRIKPLRKNTEPVYEVQIECDYKDRTYVVTAKARTGGLGPNGWLIEYQIDDMCNDWEEIITPNTIFRLNPRRLESMTRRWVRRVAQYV